MTCNHCVATVKSLMEDVAGVKQVDVSLKNNEAIVKGEPQINDIEAAFSSSPFKIALK